MHQTLEKIITAKRKSNRYKFQCLTDGKKLFIIQFWGVETLQFSQKLGRDSAPIFLIYSTSYLKPFISNVKPRIEKPIRSRLTYKIKCPQCSSNNVVVTWRRLQICIKEHFSFYASWAIHVFMK